MDANTLTQGAIEIAKAAALSVPFTAIVNRVLGPAADEYAEQLRDKRRLYRFEKELAGWKKASQMISDAGFTPIKVPPKILFPLLDGLGLEEHEDLHTMWSALLANAANPDTPELVHPSFAGVLKQLSPSDAHMLNAAFDMIESSLGPHKTVYGDFAQDRISSLLRQVPFDHRPVDQRMTEASEDDLFSYNTLQSHFLINESTLYFSLTTRGYRFVKSCRKPNGNG